MILLKKYHGDRYWLYVDRLKHEIKVAFEMIELLNNWLPDTWEDIDGIDREWIYYTITGALDWKVDPLVIQEIIEGSYINVNMDDPSMPNYKWFHMPTREVCPIIEKYYQRKEAQKRRLL